MGSLSEMLGFNSMEVIKRTKEAPRVFDPESGVYALYVYTDIIQPGLVGNALVPLLRIVPIKGKVGDTVHHCFENPHYQPLCVKQFQTVEIDIRDDTGQPVSFERGKVIVKLHFRRRQDEGGILL